MRASLVKYEVIVRLREYWWLLVFAQIEFRVRDTLKLKHTANKFAVLDREMSLSKP